MSCLYSVKYCYKTVFVLKAFPDREDLRMQKRRFGARILSLVLVLSILISAFSIFAFANPAEELADLGDGLNVVYNRTFDEGWDYDNGIFGGFLKGNRVSVDYEYRNSDYNYFLKIEKTNTDVAYAHIDTVDKLHDTGKTFVELDIAASLGNAMGQAIRASVQGDIKTLVEFTGDGMTILGVSVGSAAYAMKWESLSFVFDFSYAESDEGIANGASSNEYKITAEMNGKTVAEKVYSAGWGGIGVSQIRLYSGNTNADNIGSWYAIDNLRVYSGVDEATEIDADEYGSAVDSNRALDFTPADMATDTDGYIRGEATFNREASYLLVTNHYNRHFGEGWTLEQASSVSPLTIETKGNNLDIRSERSLSNELNYFLRFRALNTAKSYLQVPIEDAPNEGLFVIEFDIKASVNADLGNIMSILSTANAATPIAGIEDGQLSVLGKKVGYLGSTWAHLVYAFNLDEKTVTVYYGTRGVYSTTVSLSGFDRLQIGQDGGAIYDSYGDWYGLDNLQIYSGLTPPIEGEELELVDLLIDDYGFGVDEFADRDFDLESAEIPEKPIAPEIKDEDNAVPPDSYEQEAMLGGTPELERVELGEFGNVRFNRHFSEGWDFLTKGYNVSGNLLRELVSEQMIDLSVNYYQRYEASAGGGNGYWNLSSGSGSPTSGKVFIEMSLKAVEGINVGGVIQMRQKGESYNTANSKSPYLIGFNDGYLWMFNKDNKLGRIGEDEWVDLAIEIDYDYALNNPEKNPNCYLVSVWFGDDCFRSFERYILGSFGIDSFRIGFETQAATTDGHYWCMDNLKFYWGTSTFADIPADNNGSAIDPNLPKDFPIQQTVVSLDTMIAESIFLKVGSEYTLVNGVRQPSLTDDDGNAYGAPRKIDGKYWVPLDTITNFLSYPIYMHEDGVSFDISTGSSIASITIGRDTALVAGKKVQFVAAPGFITDDAGREYLVVTVDDLIKLFPEFYIDLDDMNMITFTKHEALAATDLAEGVKLNIMRDFLFDYITPEEVYERARDYTNNFDHPYIVVNQQRFDELSEAWNLGRAALADPTLDIEYDPTLYRYINTKVTSGSSSYNKYSAVAYSENGTYQGLNPLSYIFDSEVSGSSGLLMPWSNYHGYDPYGGRLTVPYDGLIPMAYAYQITKDVKYALCAYDVASMIVDWDHWGPGHFLNAADAADAVAKCYDWLYDIWVELGLNVDKIADGAYYHGALQGYLVTIGDPDPHGRAGGSGSNYTTMTNNWNAVCTSGVATAAFATLGYTGFTPNSALKSEYARNRANIYGSEMMTTVNTEVISRNFRSLINKGLDIYAPDGSYEESVSYWAYGANNLFDYCQLLESTLGSDLGLMDTWGLDRTCYSILHMVSSDYRVFAYNDGSVGGACDSGQFNYVAKSVGDDFLYLVRRMHIDSGKIGISYTDSFFYKKVESADDIVLPLQYHHVGIHGYTVRSSWEKGAIFAGLLGGDNDDGHGHIDAGQWIYYSDGVPWVEDIGADGYNTYKYFSSNTMYKTNPEGHNVICVTSDQVKLPNGQLRSSVSPVLKVFDNEYGAYSIIDTTPAYGSVITEAHRGMLFTNNRNTVIIQDEIEPTGSQAMYWFAHYSTENIVDVQIAPNGRTAYMYSKNKSATTGKELVLRLAIVSPQLKGLSFKLMGSGQDNPDDFVLDATDRPGFSESMGKQPESNRRMWKKLAIHLEGQILVKLAVVLEVIDEENPIPIGYTWTEMDEWEPVDDTRTGTAGPILPEDEAVKRTSADVANFSGYVNKLDEYREDGTLFSDLNYYYNAITNLEYVMNVRGRDYVLEYRNGRYAEYVERFDEYHELYNKYYDEVAATMDDIAAITDVLTGAKSKTESADTE